jgi:hypothetical protein
MIKKMSNAQIFALSNKFIPMLNSETRYMPAKISYFMHKNRIKLVEQMGLIEEARVNIIKHYGVLNETTGLYDVPDSVLNEANKELNELLEIEQDVEISMIKLSDLEGIDFTFEQMEILAFMIEE